MITTSKCMSYTANSVGGEYTHTLSLSEIPSHNHKVPAQEDSSASLRAYNHLSTYNVNKDSHYWYSTTSLEGGGKSHNNIPPYIVVYFWRRIA